MQVKCQNAQKYFFKCEWEKTSEPHHLKINILD